MTRSFRTLNLEQVAENFVPEQLTRAREIRALTKAALAEKVGVSPAAITLYEQGASGIAPDTLGRLALTLSFPLDFFARKPLVPALSMESCHFRSLRSTSQYLRRQILELGRVVFEVRQLLEEVVDFPHEDVMRLKPLVSETSSIEELAIEVRSAWGMGTGPISHLIPLLEARGVIVLPLSTSTREVDAFSGWLNGVPFMFLGMSKSASRTHFDAAHELGHLILHDDVIPGSPEAEREADQFASAFLMPKRSIRAELPTRWSLSTFRKLKQRWYVSIAALVYRAHHLGCIGPGSYQSAFKSLNALGFRKEEPDEWALEGPALLRDAMEVAEIDAEVLASKLGLNNQFLEALLKQTIYVDDDQAQRLGIDPKVLDYNEADYRYT